MADRLKFIGRGPENTGLDETERNQLFRFVAAGVNALVHG